MEPSVSGPVEWLLRQSGALGRGTPFGAVDRVGEIQPEMLQTRIEGRWDTVCYLVIFKVYFNAILLYIYIYTYVMLYDIYEIELYFEASCCRTCHVLLMNSMKNLPTASSLLDYVTTCTLQWPEAPKKLNVLKWKHCHQRHLLLSFVKAIANPMYSWWWQNLKVLMTAMSRACSAELRPMPSLLGRQGIERSERRLLLIVQSVASWQTPWSGQEMCKVPRHVYPILTYLNCYTSGMWSMFFLKGVCPVFSISHR